MTADSPKVPPTPNADRMKLARDRVASAIEALRTIDGRCLRTDQRQSLDFADRTLINTGAVLTRIERQLRGSLPTPEPAAKPVAL